MERSHDGEQAQPAAPERAPAPSPQSPAAQLVGLQQAAGNQAVVALLRRQADDGVVRRNGDPPAVAAAEPAAAAAAAVPAAVVYADDAKAIADPAGYVRAAGTWDAVRARYKKNLLGWTSGGDDKGKVKDGALGMNHLLAYRLQATVQKKGDSQGGTSPMEQIQPEVEAEAKRQRDARQATLKESGVDTELPPPAKLAWNYGAGSGTATSDIDVNLSGDATEFAVTAFNALFRSTWGGKEAGTVFDVNVYARDYLPETGAYSLIQAREKVEAEKPAGKAGPKALDMGSAGWGERGVKFETSLQKGSAVAKGAASSQEVFSLLKTRKDMTFVDWTRYKHEQIAAFGDDTVGRDAKLAAFDQAEAKHKAREAEIAAKVAELDAKAKLLLAEAKPAEAPKKSDDDAATKRLKAENALYERNLGAVATKRNELAVLKALLAAGKATAEQVEKASAELREALHGAAMYANEAYITGATVLHVVGNLQLLGGSEDISIELSGEDYLASANEQVGFIFDDLHREAPNVDAGLLKAGKYISRLGHAASKLEAAVASAEAGRGAKASGARLVTPTSSQLQRYGEQLMRIKEKVKPAEQTKDAAALKVDGWGLGGRSVDAVKTEILKFQSKAQALGGKL